MTDPDQPMHGSEHASEPGIGFEELREGRCKFPLGEFDTPAVRFCGDVTPPGSVYCLRHQSLAYNRLNTRR